MSKHVLDEHYHRIAERYTDFLSYSDEFVPTLAKKMVDMLHLTEDDVFVDLGGGTGIFTAAILGQVRLRNPVILVDYYAEMLDQVPAELPVEKVEADALAFSAEPRSYDKVLIKETIHHVDNRDLLMRQLYERLRSGGALLLVHVPPELDYPIFEAALERARNWHADPDELERQMRAAGFQVERDAIDWPHVIPKERYFDQVASQFMSVLSSFTPDEMEAGLAEMRQTYADTDVLEFNDHFDYIVGYKS